MDINSMKKKYHFGNISSPATTRMNSNGRSAWVPQAKPQPEWWCFLRLLLMYCRYIFTNLSWWDWRRRARMRMGKIDGERVSAMEHREQGWHGIRGGKRIRGKTAKENENENERGGKRGNKT